ncbi:MAG: DUF4351 domain-containing protein [SAR324 cluster bacterium]|nr:DUF4351 domain-containing protein [SAR324 cluster bacterium]
MLAQYIRDKGLQQGLQQGESLLLSKLMSRKYRISAEEVSQHLQGLTSAELLDLGEAMLDLNSWSEIMAWIAEKHPSG